MELDVLQSAELPGCWTRKDLQETAALCGPWANQARWPPEAVLLFLLNWALDNREHTFERYLPEAWPSLRALMLQWGLKMAPAAITPPALCQVRQRLGVKPLEALYQKANCNMLEHFDHMCRIDGLRTWAVDGSWINLPSEPALADTFGRPSAAASGKPPLPQALLVCLELVNMGWITDFDLKGCNDAELLSGIELTRKLGHEDLLMGDRLFFDTAWIRDLREREVELLLRVSSVRWKCFCDQSRETVQRLRQQNGSVDCSILLKIDTDHKGRPRGGLLPLRYIEKPSEHTGQETMRLLTSLPLERCTAEQAAGLYDSRWSIETQLRFFKGQDHLPVVLSRKPETVHQEIMLRLLAHNWIRSVQAEACRQEHAEQLSAFPPSTFDIKPRQHPGNFIAGKGGPATQH